MQSVCGFRLLQSAARKYSRSVSVTVTLAVALALSMEEPRRASGAEGVTVEVRTSCEAMAPNSCQGVYGFTIQPDGTYVSGPSPEGRTSAGRLAPSESEALQGLAQRVLLEFDDQAATCAPRVSAIPGVSESIVVSGGGKRIDLHGMAGVLDSRCAAVGARESAALFKQVHNLMSRHYPRPFP
jgi:hypothetical protein